MEEQNINLEFFHQHPLRRITNVAAEAGRNWCFGCRRYFLPGEAVYGCSIKRYCGWCLHEECAEMAREIRHPLHPSHPLKLQARHPFRPLELLARHLFDPLKLQARHPFRPLKLQATHPSHPLELIARPLFDPLKLQARPWYRGDTRCSVCDDRDFGFFYMCGEGCEFWIHTACAGDGVAIDEDIIEHPQHQLKLLRRKKMLCSFDCDACGTVKKDNSYICTKSKCDYLIHESCASLPTTHLFHHHPHSLSLAFYPPSEYIKNEYTCDICDGALRLRHWIYHCLLCRYIVHVDCATASNTTDDQSADDGEDDILKAPMHDLYEEMIRERGPISVPHDNQVITAYQFHEKNHPLRFTRFSASREHNEERDSSSDDDDDNLNKLTCDGCALPIQEKSRDEGYMSCGECNFFLHLACFNLPPQLPSHPLHQINNHKLSLQSADKLSDWKSCSVCKLSTNGLFYSCTDIKCSFQMDIKCASLPNIITHAAHPKHRHFLNLVTHEHGKSFCNACYDIIYGASIYYKCDSCRFSVCCKCVLLPASNKHRLEKHLLPLTYDASVNRPGDFYCSNCEQQMNPRTWMYHCRECDQSFHPECFPAASGMYRNFNFGRQEYHVSQHPQHSLRFQIISKKKRCDVCHDEAYDDTGFQCTSCNFAMCYRQHRRDVKLID